MRVIMYRKFIIPAIAALGLLTVSTSANAACFACFAGINQTGFAQVAMSNQTGAFNGSLTAENNGDRSSRIKRMADQKKPRGQSHYCFVA